MMYKRRPKPDTASLHPDQICSEINYKWKKKEELINTQRYVYGIGMVWDWWGMYLRVMPWIKGDSCLNFVLF